MHPGDRVALNFFPMSSLLKRLLQDGHQVDPDALNAWERSLRPDITNLTLRHLFEIRPEAQVAEARAKVALYLGLFGKAGFTMSPGPTGDPGAAGQLPAPGGVFIFWSPEPGVIVYQYRRGHLVPVPVPVPAAERGPQKQPTHGWRWELEPLSRAQEQAILTGATGTVLLILMMLLLAPVGA
jgi:hypothetical protein